jgi:hypothetical protein
MPFCLGHHSRLLRFQPSGSSQYDIEYRYLAAAKAIVAVFAHSCQLVLVNLSQLSYNRSQRRLLAPDHLSGGGEVGLIR